MTDFLRPIVGIENRTPQEVFEIMCARFGLAAARAEAAPVVDDAELLGQARGALNFILAFYEPGQRYLDTNAWKQAELSGKLALIALSRRLGVPVSAWVERSVPKAALEAALNPSREVKS